ncbi:AGC protein kinase [Puccinia sorghi]|uniref:AGC protein kinase n=1 Tax=Puccinia sorghi TaxID=27349 RepID=A0A0L6VFL1_9BASI|nr:AGC protein kinase [Puccinia sorghi]
MSCQSHSPQSTPAQYIGRKSSLQKKSCAVPVMGKDIICMGSPLRHVTQLGVLRTYHFFHFLSLPAGPGLSPVDNSELRPSDLKATKQTEEPSQKPSSQPCLADDFLAPHSTSSSLSVLFGLPTPWCKSALNSIASINQHQFFSPSSPSNSFLSISPSCPTTSSSHKSPQYICHSPAHPIPAVTKISNSQDLCTICLHPHQLIEPALPPQARGTLPSINKACPRSHLLVSIWSYVALLALWQSAKIPSSLAQNVPSLSTCTQSGLPLKKLVDLTLVPPHPWSPIIITKSLLYRLPWPTIHLLPLLSLPSKQSRKGYPILYALHMNYPPPLHTGLLPVSGTPHPLPSRSPLPPGLPLDPLVDYTMTPNSVSSSPLYPGSPPNSSVLTHAHLPLTNSCSFPEVHPSLPLAALAYCIILIRLHPTNKLAHLWAITSLIGLPYLASQAPVKAVVLVAAVIIARASRARTFPPCFPRFKSSQPAQHPKKPCSKSTSQQRHNSPYLARGPAAIPTPGMNLPSASGGCNTNPSSLSVGTTKESSSSSASFHRNHHNHHHPILTGGLPNLLQTIKSMSDQRSTSLSKASPPSRSISRHFSNSVSSRRAALKNHRTANGSLRLSSDQCCRKQFITSPPQNPSPSCVTALASFMNVMEVWNTARKLSAVSMVPNLILFFFSGGGLLMSEFEKANEIYFRLGIIYKQ